MPALGAAARHRRAGPRRSRGGKRGRAAAARGCAAARGTLPFRPAARSPTARGDLGLSIAPRPRAAGLYKRRARALCASIFARCRPFRIRRRCGRSLGRLCTAEAAAARPTALGSSARPAFVARGLSGVRLPCFGLDWSVIGAGLRRAITLRRAGIRDSLTDCVGNDVRSCGIVSVECNRS